ncbi:hypothetical protein BH11MYX1_BH11MYX1_21050 [soil metagenome]
MSYDLVCWRSFASVGAPIALCGALRNIELVDDEYEGPRFTPDEARALVAVLDPAAIIKAFRAEFGELEVTPSQIIAPTFVVDLPDNEPYFEITCSWSVKQPTLVQLRRAVLRAHCSTWDRQLEQLFEPTEFT